MRYTKGPLIATYNQIGNTHLAILLCFSTWKVYPLMKVNSMNGSDTAANMICDIKIVK